MSTTNDSTAVLEEPALAGKYMGFKLGDENYGIEILKVQEIIGLMEITGVPRTPDYLCGVINLRGKVIPVVDLRLKFGMQAKEADDLTCIMVVQVTLNDTLVTMGVMVDQVSEVMDITAENVEPTPNMGVTEANEFLLGVGKFQGHVVLLLAMDRILSDSDKTMIGAMGDE